MVENPFYERVVDNSRELARCVSEIESAESIAIDTETDGLRWALGNKPFMMTVCPNLETVYAVYDQAYSYDILTAAQQRKQVYHNAKFDLHMLRQWAGYAPDYMNLDLEDTMHAFRLQFPLDPARLKFAARRFCSKDLDVTAPQLAVHAWIAENSTRSKINGKWITVEPDYSQVPQELMLPYATQDAWMTLKCHQELEKLRDPQGKLNALYKREVRLVRLLIEMEKFGWHLDYALLMTKLTDSSDEFSKALGAFEEMAPGVLYTSPKQLCHYFYEVLGEPVRHRTKTDNPSCDETALLNMNDKPKGAIALSVRQWKKARDKYTELALHTTADSAVHTDFKPERAKTGRFGCSSPALQNVANPNPIYPHTMVREVFVPPPSKEWLFIDFSQVEMRLFAHYCKDRFLLEAIYTGVDLHSLTASRMYGVTPAEAKKNKQMRAFGKILNFTLIYGGGVNKIATALKEGSAQNDPLTLVEAGHALLALEPYASLTQIADPYVPLAKLLLKIYKEQFPDIKKFMDDVQNIVKVRYGREGQGYVKNVFGRITPVPIEKAYVAVNYIVQGTAADLLKDVMLSSWTACLEYAKIHGLVPWVDIAEFACVHDELMFQVPIGHAKSLGKFLNPVMTHWPMLSVPITADYSTVLQGSSWATKKSFLLEEVS